MVDRGGSTRQGAGLAPVKDIEMGTENGRPGAGTSLGEGKKSEITERRLLQNQGGEAGQGPGSQEPTALRKTEESC